MLFFRNYSKSVIETRDSKASLVRTPRDRQNVYSYLEFILTGVICIEKVLKGSGIVFVFPGNIY